MIIWQKEQENLTLSGSWNNHLGNMTLNCDTTNRGEVVASSCFQILIIYPSAQAEEAEKQECLRPLNFVDNELRIPLSSLT